VLGTGFAGVAELRTELSQAALEVRYERTLARHRIGAWVERRKQAPLPLVRQLLQLILLLVLFRVWRGWAREGLGRSRMRLVEGRPRSRAKLRLARFVWYAEQVRSPVEWLVVLQGFIVILDLSLMHGEVERLTALLRWCLLAWFTIKLIHSVSARGKAGMSGEIPRLRLRSLRLLATWFVLVGLGLDVAESYAGHGTLYAWVRTGFKVSLFPLLLLLTIWWRKTIFRHLEWEASDIEWVSTLTRTQKGVRGLVGAFLGGVYLLMILLVQMFVRMLAVSEWGKSLQVHLYRRAVARAAGRIDDSTERRPLPSELRARMLSGSGGLLERVGRDVVRQISEAATGGNGGVVAVVADRGFGKSVLLRRVADSLEGSMLIIDCPPGGANSLMTAFAAALDLDPEHATSEAIAQRLEESSHDVVAVDNLHRLARPIMGGQAEMDQIAGITQGVTRRLLWVLSLNRASWRYIRAARGHRLAMDQVFELPAWTERGVGELIDLRCQEAGIELDYTRLVFPRRLDEGEHDTPAERNRAAFHRLIWDISGGGPVSALRLLCDSIVVEGKNKYSVRIPPMPESGDLERVSITFLLILRVIVQCELATTEEVVESLKFSGGEVRVGLRFMLLRNWVEVVDGRYRISDTWYGTVIRVLNRRNLLAAREGVGVL
jgi:hypothetical protein